MTQVAIASGFGCVRSFNECIRKVYHRTPSQIRSLAGRSAAQDAGQYLFHLHYRPPYNWTRAVEYLAARATPGVESVREGRYRRSISLKGNHGYFEVWPSEKGNTLAVRVELGEPRELFFVIDRIRRMFDLDSNWGVIAKALRNDPELAQFVDAESGWRVPGCWSDFELTVRAILGQEMSAKEATMMAGRVVKACGRALATERHHAHFSRGGEACGCGFSERRRAAGDRGDAARVRTGGLRRANSIRGNS